MCSVYVLENLLEEYETNFGKSYLDGDRNKYKFQGILINNKSYHFAMTNYCGKLRLFECTRGLDVHGLILYKEGE